MLKFFSMRRGARNSHKKHQKGFALVILSALILGLGLIMISKMPTKPKEDNFKVDLTQERLDRVKKALRVYYFKNGKLPCPAPRTLNFNHANFTAETSGSVCGTTGTVNVSSTSVYIGAVPTRALELPPHFAIDGWNRRFTYAVDMAVAVNGLPTADSIGVTNLSGTSRGVEFLGVVISHGENGEGAYKKKGALQNRLDTTLAVDDPEYNKDSTLATNQSGATKIFNTTNLATSIYRDDTKVLPTASEKENFDGDATFIKDKWNKQVANLYDDMVEYILPCTGGATWNGRGCTGGCSEGTNWNGDSCVTCSGGRTWSTTSFECTCADGETWDGDSCETTTYSWATGSWGSCSASCGGGTQTRAVTCENDIDSSTVADSNCDGGSEPSGSQSCNTHSCCTYCIFVSCEEDGKPGLNFGSCSGNGTHGGNDAYRCCHSSGYPTMTDAGGCVKYSQSCS